MSDQHPYTPSTGEVETGFAIYQYDYENIVMSAGRVRFKAWLASHEDYVIRKWTAENDVVPHKRYTQDVAAAEQRGAIKALREAAESDDLIDYMYANLHTIQPIVVRETSKYLHKRADRLEGDYETH